MRSRWLLGWSVVAGCGFSTPASVDDAGPPDDTTVDVATDVADAPPAGTCMAKWMAGTVQLTTPARLTQLGSATSDRDPFISSDGLRLYFASERSGNGDIYVAVRATAAGVFAAPILSVDLSSVDYDSKTSIASNDLLAVQASTRNSSADTDLWIATRPNTVAAFSNFTRTPFGANNDGTAQLDPETNDIGTRVYFANGSPQRIVVVSRADPTSSFGSMVELINGGSGDADPSVSPDERLVVFASNRGGGPGGGGDLWYATRANATATTFSSTLLVPTVNGSSEDGDPSLSDDGCTLFFASNRTGDWEIYVSTVTP
ncbi:MAG: PD40 domain-containing protein [Myxococcales bacterium]|nr:PD40 domain-containing protein [Myxococcales bacterium]